MTEPLIVFVCTANICRSPWAEARGRELLPGFRVASAGIMPSTAGRPMDDTMAATLPGGFEKHRAKFITRPLVAEAVALVTMEDRHRLWLLDEYPGAIRKTFTLGQLSATLRAAPAGMGLEELLQWAYRHRVAASGHDIADPYRQGPERAAETAAVLEGLLTEIAGVLVPAVKV